jgi:hypothetical protein
VAAAAVIAGTYLAGSTTRRVRRVLFGGAIGARWASAARLAQHRQPPILAKRSFGALIMYRIDDCLA